MQKNEINHQLFGCTVVKKKIYLVTLRPLVFYLAVSCSKKIGCTSSGDTKTQLNNMIAP